MPRQRYDAPEPLGVVHRLGVCDEPPHAARHEFHVIGMLLRGGGEYHVDGRPMPGAPPWVMFVPRGDEDADGLSGFVESWYVTFYWPGLRVRPVGTDALELRWGGGRAVMPRYARPGPEAISALSRKFESMRRSLPRQDLGGALAARAALMDIVAVCVDLRGPDALLSHRALDRFRRDLEAHACDDVSIEALAARTRLTADHLSGDYRVPVRACRAGQQGAHAEV